MPAADPDAPDAPDAVVAKDGREEPVPAADDDPNEGRGADAEGAEPIGGSGRAVDADVTLAGGAAAEPNVGLVGADAAEGAVLAGSTLREAPAAAGGAAFAWLGGLADAGMGVPKVGLLVFDDIMFNDYFDQRLNGCSGQDPIAESILSVVFERSRGFVLLFA